MTDPNAQQICRASQLAASVWGGVFFPILRATDPDVVRQAESHAVDFLFPLDEEAATVELCTKPGFRWRGSGDAGPFGGSAEEDFRTGLLPAHRIRGSERSTEWQLNWDEGHELASLFDVWLGRSTAPAVDAIPISDDWTHLPHDASPLALTALHLRYAGAETGLAIVVVRPGHADDLIRLWNLRASGRAVHPWVIGHEDSSARSIESWLAVEDVMSRASVVRRGDGAAEGPLAWVGVEPGGEISDVRELLLRHGFALVLETDRQQTRGWMGHHPIQTSLERDFNIQVAATDWQVDIPLATAPVASYTSRWPGVVVADISVHQEAGTPQDRVLALPAIRDLASAIDDRTSDCAFHRPTGDGRALAVQGADEQVTVGLVRSIDVFRQLLNATVTQSDDGRFATQLIERLGGVRSAAATQPGLRAVLYRVSTSDRARPIAELIEHAKKNRGRWPGRFSQQEPREYAERVVYSLAHSKLLVPSLAVRCPTCATETDVRPEDLRSEIRCDLCQSEVNLGFALAVQGAKNPWRYRLAANISSGRIRSGLAMMATFGAVSSSYRAGGAAVVPHVFGLEVDTGDGRCEIDVAAILQDGPMSVAVIGEAKGGNDPFDRTDVQNLERIQGRLREAGIETLLAFGTTRDTLSAEEVSLLREMCSRAPMRLRQPHELALPVVLCGNDMSMPWMDPESPWRWGSPGDTPLAGFSRTACERNLGLAIVQRNSSEWFGRELRWISDHDERHPGQ